MTKEPIRAKRVVMIDQADWDALPEKLTAALHRQATEGPGRFTVVSGETGEPIEDMLLPWLCGKLVLAFAEIQGEDSSRA